MTAPNTLLTPSNAASALLGFQNIQPQANKAYTVELWLHTGSQAVSGLQIYGLKYVLPSGLSANVSFSDSSGWGLSTNTSTSGVVEIGGFTVDKTKAITGDQKIGTLTFQLPADSTKPDSFWLGFDKIDSGIELITATNSSIVSQALDAPVDLNVRSNKVPVAPATPASLDKAVANKSYAFPVEKLLAGFTDADGDTLSVSNLSADRGSLSSLVSGKYTYTPPKNYSGIVTLSYNVVDGFGGVVPVERKFTVIQKGIAQDGYLANALVWTDTDTDGLWTHEGFTDKNNNQQVDAGEYVDSNSNGVFDAESWDITDASGNFEGLTGSGSLKIEAWVYNANGSVPTIDLSTGKTFSGSLTAPSGSSVINPLTTLVQSAIASGKTEAQAQTLVKAALGVSDSVNLTSFDPVAQAQDSTQASEALKVQKAALQVANLMQVAVDTTAAAGATNLGSIVDSVSSALVLAANSAASNSGSPTINLSNASLMASAISAAADTAFASSTDTTAKAVLKAQAQSIGAALSQVNTTIDTIVSSAIQAAGSGQTVDAASAMVNIVAAQIVANEQVSAQAQNSVVQAVLTGDTTSTGSINVNVAQSLELAKSKVAQVFVTQLGAAPLAVNNQIRLQLPGSLTAQRNALTESDNVLSNDTADAAYTKAISAAGYGAATSLTALASGTLTLTGSYGSLRLNSDGTFLYTEDKAKTVSILANQSAQDVFTYELSDSTGTDTRKDTATLTIGLDRLNFAPSVQVGQLKLKEQGASLTGDGETALNFLALASDADDESLSISAVRVGTQALGNATTLTTNYGTLSLKQGSYYYTPDQSNSAVQALGAGQSLKETVSFSVSDGVNSAVSGALQITIQGANDSPTLKQALADYRVTENRTLSMTVPATSFADVDDATLTYSAKLANGSALPIWIQFNATNRTFSIAPGTDVVASTAQTFAVQVTASDAAGLQVSDSFDLLVRPLGSGYDIQANVSFWKSGANGQKPNLAGVSLSKGLESGTSTSQAGVTLHSVEDTEGADDGFMTLAPQASSPSNAKEAITLTDVLAALKIYLGKALPDSYASPLNYLAADFDGNGIVNLTDVLTLLKYYLGKTTTSAPAWVFVDAADFSTDGKNLTGANNLALSKTEATPHAIDQSFDSGHETVQIIGVLRGDVDGSWVG